MVRPLVVVLCVALLGGCKAGTDVAEHAPTTRATAPGAPAPLPEARTEVAGVAWQGKVVVLGGLTADGMASTRVDVFDPGSNRWSAGAPLPVALHHMGAAVLGDRIVVAGGYTTKPGGAWEAQSAVRSLGPTDMSWRDEPSLSAARGGLAMVAVRDRLVAVGGTDASGKVLARVEVLAPRATGWTPGPDMLERRDHLAAASADGRIFAIAGRQGGMETNLRTVESWDPEGPEPWRPEPGLNQSRGGTSAVGVSRLCVTGGEEPGGTIGSVECLTGERWERIATLREPRHGLAVVQLDGVLHVIAGGPKPGLFVSTTHEVIPL